MKLVVLVLLTIVINYRSLSQVGIGTTSPHPSSILEIKSSNKGFLMPRMTGVDRGNITNPSQGLMIYCLNCCSEGVISVYSNDVWVNMPSCILDDLDSDGISNLLDFDDDNDGILDEEECSIVFADLGASFILTPSSGPVTTTSDHLGGVLPITMTINPPTIFSPSGVMSNAKLESALGSSLYNNKNIALTFKANGSRANTDYIESVIDFSSLAAFRLISDPSIFNSTSASALNDIDIIKVTPITPSANFKWIVESSLFCSISFDGNTLIITGTGSGVDYARYNIFSEGESLGIITRNHTTQNTNGNGTRYALSLGCSDADGDGIPNKNDWDSDNDGIPDANEAGYTTSTNPNFHFNNPCGANGVYDSLEVSPETFPIILITP